MLLPPPRRPSRRLSRKRWRSEGVAREQIYDTLPCSTLRVSLETEGNGQSHPFAPWSKCKKHSRREHLRLRFYPFSRLQLHAAPYCRLNQQRRFTFEASGGWTKPTSARGYRPASRRLLRAELSHQRIHLRLTGFVQCAAQRYLRFTQSEFLHLFQLGAHQPRGSRGP